jgi:hypothetical protein
MILKHPLGTTSDKSGYFELHITEKLSNDTLVISHIGYQTQHVAIDTLKFTSIELQQTSYVLEEVTIANPLKKNKHVIINQFHEKDCSLRYSTSPFGNSGTLLLPYRPKEPTIEAIYIPYSEEYKGKIVKEVDLYIKNYNNTTSYFRLRCLAGNLKKEPGIDLLKDSKIIEVSQTTQNVTVDLEDYFITIPKNGIFIGFELLMIPENEKQIENDLGIVATIHSPFLFLIRTNPKSKTYGDYWIYSKGSWQINKYWYFSEGAWFMSDTLMNNTGNRISGPYLFTPAISLTLSD